GLAHGRDGTVLHGAGVARRLWRCAPGTAYRLATHAPARRCPARPDRIRSVTACGHIAQAHATFGYTGRMNDPAPAMNDEVLQLYPPPTQGVPLSRLYLEHPLHRISGSESGLVYSNFVSSLDGRIALP